MATKLSKIINHWVPENSKVIDFGCGDGSLLKELIETKNILGYGVEINNLKIEKDSFNYRCNRSRRVIFG